MGNLGLRCLRHGWERLELAATNFIASTGAEAGQYVNEVD
jgi:hypothetical protein